MNNPLRAIRVTKLY